MLLLDEIRAATGRQDLSYAAPPAQLTGGFWAEIVSFTLSDPPPGWPRALVARVMPDPHTARKESVVQAVVAGSGFPTPAVRLTGGPDSRLGRAFMVMDLASGAPLLPGLDGLGALVSGLRQASQIPDVLASTMAALHAVDPEPVRAGLGERNSAVWSVPGLLDFLRDAAARIGRDDLVAAADALIARPRPSGRDVICHGDLHPFNVLVDGDRVTVLDWSASLLGSAAYDVAFTTLMLAEPPLVVPGAFRPLLRRLGGMLAGRFLRRYRTHAGIGIGRDDLRWHQGVVCLRMLTEVAGWVHDGTISGRAGHPFLISGRELAGRLSSVTGVPVRPR